MFTVYGTDKCKWVYFIYHEHASKMNSVLVISILFSIHCAFILPFLSCCLLCVFFFFFCCSLTCCWRCICVRTLAPITHRFYISSQSRGTTTFQFFIVLFCLVYLLVRSVCVCVCVWMELMVETFYHFSQYPVSILACTYRRLTFYSLFVRFSVYPLHQRNSFEFE